MNTLNNRRNFLKIGAASLGTLLVGSKLANAADTCVATVPQTSGPFYPGESKFIVTSDLTTVPGAPRRALGEVVYIRGVVRDQFCQPIEGANVEIWQACESGRYNNEIDPNPAPLDPHFRYWGEAFTDAKGEYIFKTIVPGAYPAADDWDRPPHIHFRVAKRGYEELITQSYFKGHPLNDVDKILERIAPTLREGVIVDFQPSPQGFEPNTKMGQFDITIQKI